MEDTPTPATDPIIAAPEGGSPASTEWVRERAHPHWAGFWRRLLAHIVDTIVIQLATWLIEYPLLGLAYLVFRDRLGEAGPGVFGYVDAFKSLHVQAFEAGLYLCLSFPYFVWGTYRYGTTLGKALVRVRVVSTHGFVPVTINQAIVRWASYLLSYLPLGAGFIMAAFHPEKRALHDLIAGTVSVVQARRERASETTEKASA